MGDIWIYALVGGGCILLGGGIGFLVTMHLINKTIRKGL